jgi:hypothetical protein
MCHGAWVSSACPTGGTISSSTLSVVISARDSAPVPACMGWIASGIIMEWENDSGPSKQEPKHMGGMVHKPKHEMGYDVGSVVKSWHKAEICNVCHVGDHGG